MSPAELGGGVLKAVSRSFYLSIRILPQNLRGPIGLAYLLARASDTIADSATAGSGERLAHLGAFQAMIEGGHSLGMAALQQGITPADEGERRLIARLPDALAWLAALGPFDRSEIRRVMARIIRGQSLDLERFGNTRGLASLRNAAELEEYTYLVAGCVGEFWTRICLHHLPRYSRLEEGELCRLGRRFGQGLQLVNILRDLPADRLAGRCYLPEDELRAASSEPSAPAQDVYRRWLERAAAWLEDGRAYTLAIRPARVRIACFLPWFLGVETLRRLAAQPPLDDGALKIKVPRSTVREALLRAPLAALSNRALRSVPGYALERK